MLASVSPASYLDIINGQSDCGIFPRLLDFSIATTLGLQMLYWHNSAAGAPRRTTCSARTYAKGSNSQRIGMMRCCWAASRRKLAMSETTGQAGFLVGDNSGK